MVFFSSELLATAKISKITVHFTHLGGIVGEVDVDSPGKYILRQRTQAVDQAHGVK